MDCPNQMIQRDGPKLLWVVAPCDERNIIVMYTTYMYMWMTAYLVDEGLFALH